MKNPGYLKVGNNRIASRISCTEEEARQAKEIIKSNRKTFIENTNENANVINEFETYLNRIGVSHDEVKSVKFWQTQSGELRYSIVTNREENELPKIEDVVEALLKEEDNLPKIEQQEIVEPIRHRTLIVYLSDMHIGSMVSDEALYENYYNPKELEYRLGEVFIEILNAYKTFGVFTNLYVVNLGDSLDGLDGYTTRRDHRIPQNLTNKEAFETFIKVHKDFYRRLITSRISANYKFIHITNSNHGGEFEYFATRCLEEYMKLIYANNPVEFFTCTKFLNHFTIGEHIFIFTHGKDDSDMKLPFPLNLDTKTESFILDYARHNDIPLNNLHVVKGDLHQANTNHGKFFRYRNIPSLFGSSKWMMANFGNTRPGFSFDMLDGKIVYSWDINF